MSPACETCDGGAETIRDGRPVCGYCADELDEALLASLEATEAADAHEELARSFASGLADAATRHPDPEVASTLILLAERALAPPERHTFEPSTDNRDRCAVCGNDRAWHPRAWR